MMTSHGDLGTLSPWLNECYEDSDREQTSAALTACYRRFWELGISEAELRAIDTPMFVAVGDNDRLLETSVRPLSAIRPDIPVEI